jgi:hypothetical protein
VTTISTPAKSIYVIFRILKKYSSLDTNPLNNRGLTYIRKGDIYLFGQPCVHVLTPALLL